MRIRPDLFWHRVLFVLGLVLLAGCSGSADSSSSTTASRGSAASSGGAGAQSAAQAATAPAAATTGRSVVRTAGLTVQVADVRLAARRARTAAEAAGGSLEAEDASDSGDVLRLRVAPDRLDTVLDALAGLGHEQARTVGSEDVSEQVADVDSRLATSQASVARVRALLARAGTIADIVALEAQLTQRESDLESLQARAKALGGQVELATVTLTLETAPPSATRAATGFGAGLDGGVAAFGSAARVAALVAGSLLPFTPLLALGLWGLRRYHRRASPVA